MSDTGEQAGGIDKLTLGGAELPPHGIRGFAQPEPNYEAVAWASLCALAVLMIAYWWFVRRSQKKKKQDQTLPPVDPVKALIDHVRTHDPAEAFGRAEQEEYFYQLSSRLRQLVELKTGIPAAEATLRELKPQILTNLPLAEAERQQVVVFLERADQIKYAGVGSDRGEAEAAREKVLQWMLQLTGTP